MRNNRSMHRWVAWLILSCFGACGWAFQPVDPAAGRSLPPVEVPPAQPGVAYERCYVFGDMGTGSADQRAVAKAMAQRAREEPIHFILTTGDNFYPAGVLSVDDPQWKTKFENIYNDPELDVPIYASLGNHDHLGNPQAQIEYSKHSKRWIMPDEYYTFTRALTDGTRVQFIALDTDTIHEKRPEASAQLAWLEKVLAASEADWKIAFGHHPVFSHGMHGNTSELVAKLEPVFVKGRLDLYICGHDHTLEMLKPVRGVSYVVSGGGGGADKAYEVKWTDDAFYAATLGGFVQLRMSKSEIVIEFIRLDSRTQYAHVLTHATSATSKREPVPAGADE